eukprot:TRINITY_DN9726_c0_g1_i2.p2 TRINITY_DN9726_c0_g1~~TRINITY_DN9726_c0_g1_i2.p2  ORF type:complete len:116 (+),score=16.11 TRINITY_DN9726_c0_g1_i2:65-412(+)
MGNLLFSEPNMSAVSIVEKAIAGNDVVVFSKTYCPYCTRAKSALKDAGVKFDLIELDTGDVSRDGDEASGAEVQNVIKTKYSHRTVPAVFVKGKLLGGCDDTLAAIKNGSLKSML